MQEFPIAKVFIDGRAYWHDVERDKLLPVVRGGDGPVEETPAEEVPAEEAAPEGDAPAEDAETVDITALSDEDLVAAGTNLEGQFAAIFDAEGDPTSEQISEMTALAEQIDAVRAETARRAAEAEANRAAAAELAERVRPAEPIEGESEPVVEIAAAATVPAEDVLPRGRRLNLSLAEIRARAPEVVIDTPAPQHRLAITAAADLAGIVAGAEFDDLESIANAFQFKANNMPIGRLGADAARGPVVQIQREHAITIGNAGADLSVITDAEIARLMGMATDVEAFAAAGGWCAPSTIIYNLFNISADDGMWDVPTVGITRGGIKVPTSPALADFLSSVWLWTEADDIATITGTGTKPCVRVPCPAFTDVRLEAHGICVTAGMLTDASYPEATVNFVKLLMDAHRHVMNARHLANAEAASTAVTLLSPADGAAANLLSGVELGAVDYREKFGMADDSILEVVMPRWNDGVIRADLSRRMGIDLLGVTDAMIADWFNVRDVKVQYVADWQSRLAGAAGTTQPGATTPLTAWPTTSKFLLYAPGTFAVGEGPNINLGVIHDSVLNAENDMTAAWSEETSLVAKLGHESRVYTTGICPDGVTGAGANAACPLS